MSEVLVYSAAARAQTARTVLAAACQATGIGARLEVYGTGSLYQRLGPRHAPPLPDIVLWFGPFAAQAASLDGLLQAYQPPNVSQSAAHDPAWRWTTLDFASVGALGSPPAAALQELAAVPRLALADPERSEAGMAILLSLLHRARVVEGDVERAWMWLQQRLRRGLVLAEDDGQAVGAVADRGASHALTLADTGLPLEELALIPNAVGLAASARNVAAARNLLDWLTGEAASSALRLSPWSTPGPTSAPPLDVDWARQEYTAARRRWAASGFGPLITG